MRLHLRIRMRVHDFLCLLCFPSRIVVLFQISTDPRRPPSYPISLSLRECVVRSVSVCCPDTTRYCSASTICHVSLSTYHRPPTTLNDAFFFSQQHPTRPLWGRFLNAGCYPGTPVSSLRRYIQQAQHTSACVCIVASPAQRCIADSVADSITDSSWAILHLPFAILQSRPILDLG